MPLRVGGEVVYSTCTLLPEEDEVVIDAVLREFTDNIIFDSAGHDLVVEGEGVTVDRNHIQLQSPIKTTFGK